MNERPEKILIVDDEFNERERMAALLQAVGHPVVVAASFVEAVRVSEMQDEPIALIITDVVLPGGDGFKLAKEISAHTGTEPSVLFISGVTGSKLLNYHGVSKADPHFLPKPFSKGELLRRVRKLLSLDRTVRSMVWDAQAS